ncbi:MAG: tetratricopeptide repeat protein [Candidatus Omnitrophica bacterium]|nr:tetratricopeptide repeat protein [Candidatus Omnitrophota bacterium]
MAETEVEPRIENNERSTMQKVLEMIANDEMSKATETIEKEIARDEDASPVFDFTLANLYFQMEKFEKALSSYQIAVEKFPKFRRAWKNMSLIYVRQGRLEEALPGLTRVIELGGSDAITYGLLGYAYSSVENHISAESAYRMAILLEPKTLDWKMGLARSLFKQERYAEAASLCGQLIENHPDRSDLWLLQANAYIGLNQPVKAAEIYELVNHLGQATVASLNMLGDIYINEELYDMAVESYIGALEKDPEKSTDRTIRSAKVLSARGAYEETRKLVDTVEGLRKDQLSEDQRKDLLKLKARLAVADGSDEEEVNVLQQIVELDPLDGEALILLGQHSSRTGDMEKAEFYYERAANIEKFEADAKVRHAQLLVKSGKYDEALPLLRRAQQVKPRDNVQEYLEQVERVSKNR